MTRTRKNELRVETYTDESTVSIKNSFASTLLRLPGRIPKILIRRLAHSRNIRKTK